MDRIQYDDFYVAYLDSKGNIIYPTDVEESKMIRRLLKNTASDNYIYTDDNRLCYKMRVKRKEFNGQYIQVLELSNVTEYMDLIANASLDEVTHLNNRKLVTFDFLEYIEYASKENEDFALILADVDNFKGVNDTYGHATGDIVLSEISRMIYCSTRHNQGPGRRRNQDIVGRYGGDEFLVVLKNISPKSALKKTEIIANNVRNHQIPMYREDDLIDCIPSCSLSIGLYHIESKEISELFKKGYSVSEIGDVLYNRCDSALAISKKNGKDRITAYNSNSMSKEPVLRLQ